MIIEILRGTPIWVYAVFAWLVWNGIAQLRDREIAIRPLWIMPLIFVLWGLLGLAQSGAVLHWLLAALIAMPLGFHLNARLRIDRERGRVWQAASVIPLLRNLLLFGGHYVLQVAAAIDPAQRARFMDWDLLVSGLGAGYFIAWSIRFVLRYREGSAGTAQSAAASKC